MALPPDPSGPISIPEPWDGRTERRRENVALSSALGDVRNLQTAVTGLATAVAQNQDNLRAAELRLRLQIRWTVGTAVGLFFLLVIYSLFITSSIKRSLDTTVRRGHSTLECLLGKSEAARVTNTDALTDCRQAAEVNTP